MAKKKKVVRKATPKKFEITWHFFVPSVVGGLIAWFFSGSFTLAVEVIIAVVIGSFIVRTLNGKN